MASSFWNGHDRVRGVALESCKRKDAQNVWYPENEPTSLGASSPSKEISEAPDQVPDFSIDHYHPDGDYTVRCQE